MPAAEYHKAVIGYTTTTVDNIDVPLSTRASENTLSGIKGQTDKLTFDANNNLQIAIASDQVGLATESTVSALAKDDTLKTLIASTPNVYNVECTNADTEYSQALPSGVKILMLRARGGVVKYCFTSGESGTKYITLNDGESHIFYHLNASVTIYCQSPSAGTVLEILAWT